MKFLASIFVAAICSLSAHAQLQDGSIAPDFIAIDINGDSHHLYEYLDAGEQVFLYFDATWNLPGWYYYNSTLALVAFHNVYSVYNGGNSRVLFIEIDDNTNINDINGTGSNTQGNWNEGTIYPIPIIEDANFSISGNYQVQYLPTVYHICPNRLVTEMVQPSFEELALASQSVCEINIDGVLTEYTGDVATCGQSNLSISVYNAGNTDIVNGNISITGQLEISFPWFGVISPNESQQIFLGTYDIQPGDVQISFVGTGDEIDSNNTVIATIAQPQEASNLIDVLVNFQNFPEAFSLQIYEQTSGNVFYEIPQGTYVQENTAFFDYLNITEPGCYVMQAVLPSGEIGLFEKDACGNQINLLNPLLFETGNNSLNAITFPFLVSEIYVLPSNPEPGCTDNSACNFNAAANCDNGSCVYPGTLCDDGMSNTYNDMYTNNCNCQGTPFSYGVLSTSTEELIICNGESITLTFDELPLNLGNFTFQWYESTNGFLPSPSTDISLIEYYTAINEATSASWSPEFYEGEKSFACLITPEQSTGLPSFWAEGSISLLFNNIESPIIIGNPNITPFTAYSYAVNPEVGVNYTWEVLNGAIVGGQETSVVQVMWGQEGPYEILVTADNGVCFASSTLVVINNDCSLTAEIGSNNGFSICQGQQIELSVLTTASNPTYQWYLNGEVLMNESSSTLSANTGGSYQVLITDNNCSAISETVNINLLPELVLPEINVQFENGNCGNAYATLTPIGGNANSYEWSTGEQSATIVVSLSGEYTLLVSNSSGCYAYTPPVILNFAQSEPNPICLVTVDETTGYNTIIWEPITSELVTDYLIYKETNVANQYESIGSVSYGSDGVFVDESSNSAVQASRYKIGVMDICNVESTLSSLHKTIHLTSNLGVGNTVNLIWSHYEGFEFGSYNIYRGTAADNMTLLTTIASNLNSYTDLLPLTNGYYMIEVEGVSCDPSRSIQTSKSNVINYEFVGVNEVVLNNIKLYPNPAIEYITLEIPSELIGETMVIYDVTGREIYRSKTANPTNNINVASFSSGSYVLRVGNQNLRFER